MTPRTRHFSRFSRSTLPLLLLGWLALVSQVVVLRELAVVFYGVELAYLVAMAAWMAGGAAGAAFARRAGCEDPPVGDDAHLGGMGRSHARSPSAEGSDGLLAWLLAASAASLPVAVALIRASRHLLGAVPGAYLPFDRQLLTLLASTLPPSFLLGVAFRRAAGLAARGGRPLAVAYGIESAGAVAGGLAATLAFQFGVQNFSVAVAAAGLALAALAWRARGTPASPDPAGSGPVPAARRSRAGAVCGRGLPPLLVLAVTAACVLQADRFDLSMTRWSHPSVVESRDSPYARITATSAHNQVAIFVDDVIAYDSETVRNEELAHLSALQHPAPRRMLLLGGSVERYAEPLGRHSPTRLDVVELDPVLVEVSERHLGLRRQIVFDDPRRFSERPATYDVIVVGVPEPTSGQTNRFYTAEFFRTCARRLAAGGVLGLRLTLPENVLTPPVAFRTASIVLALRSAFAFVDVLPGTAAIVLASSSALPQDPEVLADRARARHLDARLVTPAYLHYLYENDRRPELARRLRLIDAPMNTDARPVCYRLAALVWLTRFFPGLLGVDPARVMTPGRWPAPVRWGGALLAVATIAIVRARRTLRGMALAVAAGLAGALLETVVMLDYQAKSGALFGQLGLLAAAFMAGLAAGASLVGGVTSDRARPAGIETPSGEPAARTRRAARLAALLCLAQGALALWIAEVVGTGAAPGFPATLGVLAAVGAVVAGLFGCAGALDTRNADVAAGRLYASDLAGGAVGSLLAGLALIPLFGLAATAWVVACLSAAALLVI